MYRIANKRRMNILRIHLGHTVQPIKYSELMLLCTLSAAMLNYAQLQSIWISTEVWLLLLLLGGLVFKMLACCVGGPGSISGWKTQNFPWTFINKISAACCSDKMLIGGPLYQCLCWASKRSHMRGKFATCLLSPHQSTLVSSKNLP